MAKATSTSDQATVRAEGSELSQDAKQNIASSLAIAAGLFMTSVTMVVPTRAPMVLTIKAGDAAATARVMGLMSASAAAIEVFVNPVFGRLADAHGRKPFLLLAPTLNTVLHAGVAAFPSSLRMTFIDRMISGAMIFSFLAPMNAAISDMFSGSQLALNMARNGTLFGLGCALGPFIGAKLGGARSFAASSAMFAATWLWVMTQIPETLTANGRKNFSLEACSPLRFLTLFQRGRVMSALAAAIGLQSFGDYVNIYDINFLYMKSVLGYGQAEVGNFATAVGLSQIGGGKAMEKMLTIAGQKSATLAANIMWIISMGLLGSSRSAYQLCLALFVMTFGHQRGTPVGAYLQKHGQAAGLGRAEIAAAQANLLAVVKVGIPILYGNIFAWATSRGRNLPGLPYFLIACLTLSAQLTLWSVDADKEEPVTSA